MSRRDLERVEDIREETDSRTVTSTTDHSLVAGTVRHDLPELEQAIRRLASRIGSGK